MTDERRAHPRRTAPMDGFWRGASGDSQCRIADVSWGGCFVETVSDPVVGEATVITVQTPSGLIELPSRIVSVERGIGFSVEFQTLSERHRQALSSLLGEPSPPA